jgi:hypothetical protein
MRECSREEEQELFKMHMSGGGEGVRKGVKEREGVIVIVFTHGHEAENRLKPTPVKGFRGFVAILFFLQSSSAFLHD